MSDEATFTISIDTGGTFTDLVLADHQSILGLYKASTTYPELFEGISAAIKVAADAQGMTVRELLERTSVFSYSTTHSTNAIIKGTTARTAFLTTRGHRDILLYKEGGKDQVYNWVIPFPEPYIPRNLTFELTERVLAEGDVAVPLDEAEVRRVLARLRDLEVEAVAVCLLWAPMEPAHELRVAELIEEMLPGVDYSLSHRVNRITREYRRASATAIDASLKPLMRDHLRSLDRQLRGLGFEGQPLMVTHVTGGVLHLGQMVERPIQTVDSGPALAPVAGIELDAAEPGLEHDGVLVVDTGGTSFDASLILDGRVAYTREKWLGPKWYGAMTGLPAVDTQSIGAGGGSIASVDAGGLLHVGPDSAGSDPGPVAYGRGGTEPTVTDAALVLGLIDPENFLGGRMRLDRDAAREVIAAKLGEPLRMSPEECAEAVLVVASEQMRGLLVDLTVSQGRDARRCKMIAGGGAAGLNIVRIARELEIAHLVIPKMAGGLSALGGQFADITMTFSHAHYTKSSEFDFAGVNDSLREIDAGLDSFFAEVQYPGEQRRRFGCEARYDQQIWEIDVDLGQQDTFGDEAAVGELKAAFDRNHDRLFAVDQPESPIEILTWRGEARVIRAKPALAARGPRASGGGQAVASATRPVFFGGEELDTPVYRAADIEPGAMIVGPAILEEDTTSIVLDAGSSAVAKDSHYLVSVGASA
jgi:N-methylhydantoinase A